MNGKAEIPEILREKLLFKISSQCYDLQNVIAFCYDENCSIHKYYNIAVKDISAYEDIYCIDHIWSFDDPTTVSHQLLQSSQLQHNMAIILHLSYENYDNVEHLVEDIVHVMWSYVSSYQNENGQTVYFIQDQIGCGFLPSYAKVSENSEIQIPNSQYSVPFNSCIYESPDGTCYTVVWPIRDIKEHEPLQCFGINSGLLNLLSLLKVVDCEPFLSPEDYGTLFEEPEPSEETEKLEIEESFDEEIVDPHHLSFPPSIESLESTSAIKEFSELLSTTNYTVQSITSLLQLTGFDCCLPVWELSSPKYQNLMYNRLRLYLEKNDFDENSLKICCIISLFCLGIPLPLSEVVGNLGHPLVESFLKLGVLFFQSSQSQYYLSSSSTKDSSTGMISSMVQIIPTFHINTQTTLYFMTDFSHHSSHKEPLPTSPISYDTYFEPVMYIGPDSLALFQSLSPSHTTRQREVDELLSGLDVFSGCGIQGITALKINLLDKMTFVEKNHRAIRFLRFNLLLNLIPLDRVTIIHDSVENFQNHFQEPPNFQLILANPPYIPTGISKDNHGLLGYGAGGNNGEEFIALVYTTLLRYLSTPTSSSSSSSSSGIYLVSNLINIHEYTSKLSQWIQSLENQSFLEKLNQLNLGFIGYIPHDKPWTPHQYAELILNRNNSQSSKSNIIHNIDEYTEDIIRAGVQNVCNGLIFLKLHHAALEKRVGDDDEKTSLRLDIEIEESKEEVWQLLNFSEIMKIRNLELRTKIQEYMI